MEAVVKARATLRPYFKELWQHCQSNDIPLAIVTVGLDFYVNALLDREQLEEVPRYTVRTSFNPDGITFEYPHTWDGSGASTRDACLQWGTCKCSVLSEYRRSGHSIIYVGDGRSDICPASIADHVFARSQLAHLCGERQLPYTEFEDFRPVIQRLEGWAGHHQHQGDVGPALSGGQG
jgi:2,3-diketo-5-methylthio-1-phosphopentane phosphatase